MPSRWHRICGEHYSDGVARDAEVDVRSQARGWPSLSDHGDITIEYALEAAGSTGQVMLVDAQGRLVRNIPLTQLERGAHQVLWDRRYETGEHAGAGVYFARVVLDGRQVGQTRMVLVNQQTVCGGSTP